MSEETALPVVSVTPALLELRPADGWEEKYGSWWLGPVTIDVRELTRLLVAQKARLMTVSGTDAGNGETCLHYHWDYQNRALTFSIPTVGNQAVSIADLLGGADWIEREIRDYFAVAFTGRSEIQSLMLRPGLEPGLNRKGGNQ